jgi:hypothetical protein
MSVTPVTCTVGPSAVTGERCGKPAAQVFFGANGEMYAECAAHAASVGESTARDTVEVHRHGRIYIGRVVRVTSSGTVYAEVTYNNGVTRVVPV